MEREKNIVCPWCNEKVEATSESLSKRNAEVIEWRCTNCGKVLAAYNKNEKGFMPKIRVFDW